MVGQLHSLDLGDASADLLSRTGDQRGSGGDFTCVATQRRYMESGSHEALLAAVDEEAIAGLFGPAALLT